MIIGDPSNMNDFTIKTGNYSNWYMALDVEAGYIIVMRGCCMQEVHLNSSIPKMIIESIYHYFGEKTCILYISIFKAV